MAKTGQGRERPCELCGVVFVVGAAQQRYCTARCREVARAARIAADADWAAREKERITRKQVRSNAKKTPEQRRSLHLQRLYGITAEEFAAKELAQNGKCAICGLPETTRHRNRTTARKLCVDHNHRNGQVRGLLCSRCNCLIGLGGEEAEVLLAAVAYMDSHRG